MVYKLSIMMVYEEYFVIFVVSYGFTNLIEQILKI